MIYQVATFQRFSRIGVSAVFLVCGIALAGWLLDLPVLASIVPGWPRMALIVALCFLLCGAATLELTRLATNRVLDLARLIAAYVALAISASTLADFMLAGGFNGEAAATINLLGPRLGSQSPATAFNFLVAAAAFGLRPRLLLEEGLALPPRLEFHTASASAVVASMKGVGGLPVPAAIAAIVRPELIDRSAASR